MSFAIGLVLGYAIGHFGLKVITDKVKGWFAKGDDAPKA